MSVVSAAPEVEVPPAFLWVPDHVSTAGGEAADLAEQAGLPLDPEQRLALDAILAEKQDGRWAAFEAAVIAPRQNIKTHLFKASALGDIYLFDLDLVVWTAHEFNTAMEAFRDLWAIIDGTPFLSRRVKRPSFENGNEGIEFMTGQRLRFKARTLSGGRGLTGDKVYLDEAFALKAAHMGSLMPTMSAKSVEGNPQLVYGSSACLVASTVLRSIVKRGRAGGDPSLAFVEWCAAEGECETPDCDHRVGSVGCVLDDVERWHQANLSLHRRISVEFVGMERRSLPPEEFARERLGWHDEPAGNGDGLPLDRWEDCCDPDAEPADPVVLAVDVSPNQVSAAIVACGGPVEVVDHRRGTAWVAGRVADLVAAHEVSAVGLDPAGPAGALIADLERPVADGGAGLRIRSASNPDGLLVLLDGRESQQACGSIWSAVVEGSFVHRDQPILNDAVKGAARRQVGDAWKWSRRDSAVDITPLVGATVARFLWVRGVEEVNDVNLW